MCARALNCVEQHNQLMVVSGVGHFTRLEYLCVDDNQIVKLASLASCTALVELYARRNRIRRVEDVDVSKLCLGIWS